MGPIRLGSEKVWVRLVLGPKRFESESSQKFWVRVVLGPSCLTFLCGPIWIILSLCIDYPVESCKIIVNVFGSMLPNLSGY